MCRRLEHSEAARKTVGHNAFVRRRTNYGDKTMNQHQELAIKALNNMRGDDLYRAKCAFGGYSPEQMNEEYGSSGKTPTEIIAGYEAHEAKVDAAINWVTSA
jgi:hypothetical protein